MTVALATLAFLIAAWAAASALLVALDDSGAKILAALKGQSRLAREPLPVRQVTVRFSARPARKAVAVPTRVEWRAAA